MLDAEKVRELFFYNSKTGVLKWKKAGRGRRPNRIAGALDGKGYCFVHLRPYGFYRTHRIIWLWKTGKWPPGEIDHKNGIRSDNRWCNLRSATRLQNCHNTRRTKSKTGIKGVFWHDECKGYAAVIHAEGRKIWLGAHKTPELAAAAYRKAAKKYFGEFARAS